MKTFQVRHEVCSRECASAARRVEPQEPLDPLQQHRLKIENSEIKRQLTEALNAKVFDQRYQEFVSAALARPVTVPKWLGRSIASGKKEVTPTLSLSDWHLDECVKPELVMGRNAYNREIAKARVKKLFQNTIDICFDYASGFDYPGIVMPWLGDMLSGNIHEELRNTNADVLLSSLVYWIGPLVAGLRQIAEAFGKVYVPVVVGNHGRATIKPIHKNRVRDNFDWLLAQMVARELSGDKRITFAISESPDFGYNIYNTAYHITHGDQAKGGTGIAAQLSPLMLMVARKMKQFKFDYLACGHWHQLSAFKKVRCNGSLVGYNEYAFNGNFEYEPPQQDLWFTDPVHGIVASFPVHVQSRDEGWQTCSTK